MSKIYTKTGDKGQTALLGGKRVMKNCLEMEAIGEVDELNAFLGILIEEIHGDTEDKEITEVEKKLIKVQNQLFVVGSQLAGVQVDLKNIPKIKSSDVKALENWIDRMQKDLPKLNNFILPGGSEESALCFYARTICRRAERRVIGLSENYKISVTLKKYLNRLSDFLFVLGRWINKKEEIEDTVWRK